MNSKPYFLKKRKEFQYVASHSKKFICKTIILLSCPKTNACEESKFHVGLTVSKKVGSAVVRNKIKRRLREVCQKILMENQSLVLDEFQYVIIARKKITEVNFGEILRDTKFCLRNINKIAKNQK